MRWHAIRTQKVLVLLHLVIVGRGLAVPTLLLKFVFLTHNKINFSYTNYDIIDIKLTEVFTLTA